MTTPDDATDNELFDRLFKIRDDRLQLWANGYRPVAIKSGLKFPTDYGWTDRARRNPPALVKEVMAWPSHSNTGILADGLVPIDIDLNDPEDVYAVAEWCMTNLGNAPTRFRKNASRLLLLYRASEGEPSKVKVWNGTTREGVEVLGRGNQFMALGKHPSGSMIEWAYGAGPLTKPVSDLVAVTSDQIGELLAFASPIVGAEPVTVREPVEFRSHTGITTLSISEIREALEVIPNHDADWDWWLKIGMASFMASNGSSEGFQAFDQWSAKCGAYDRRETAKLWKSIARNPPKQVTAGTLIYEARQYDDSLFQLETNLIKPRKNKNNVIQD